MVERPRLQSYRRKARPSAPLPYVSRGELLSRGEFAFYGALRTAAAKDYLIAFKVRAADVLSCGKESWEAGFGHMVARHHLDFVLCDYRSTHILAAIELDDRSHELQRRKRRDSFLNEAFAAAAIPLVRFKAAARYDHREIRKELDRHLPLRQASRESSGESQTQQPRLAIRDAEINRQVCDTRSPAATSCAQPDPAACESVVALTKSLKDSRTDVRSSAAAALGAIGSALLSAVPDLVASLGDPDSLVRFQGAVSLEMIATNAAEVAPALNIALSSTDQDVQIVAEQSRQKVRGHNN